MVGGAVNNRIYRWLTSLIKSYNTPNISSVASISMFNIETESITAKSDSGATFHFLKAEHRKVISHIR